MPRGGGSLGAAEWLEVIGRDYLAEFLPAGGAAVKLAVAGSAETAGQLTQELRRRGAEHGLGTVVVDAARTRVHLVDELFAAVSQQLDWRAVARGRLAGCYRALGAPVGSSMVLAEVAAAADLDPGELHRGLRRRLEQSLLTDDALPRDLRIAVLRLAQGEAGFPEARPEETEAALAWLRGEVVPAAVLRGLGISGRIGRSSARPLLVSLGRLLAASGGPAAGGLIVVLDAGRLAVSRRPVLAERDGVYYSRAAVLDCWEVLRQLIDATEQMTSMLVVVVLPPDLVTDERRGLPSYSALQLRVADEVRDRRRANPFAALVRIDVRLEAVQ